MTIELVFFLTAFWVVLGLIGARMCSKFGRSGWRWVTLCLIAGPFSLSVVYDQLYLIDHESPATDSDESSEPDRALVDDNEQGSSAADVSAAWPRDDPEGRLLLQGYRGLSDH